MLKKKQKKNMLTHSHTLANNNFCDIDANGLVNGLESEDLHTDYVISQSCTKLAMALVIFVSVLVISLINVSS